MKSNGKVAAVWRWKGAQHVYSTGLDAICDHILIHL